MTEGRDTVGGEESSAAAGVSPPRAWAKPDDRLLREDPDWWFVACLDRDTHWEVYAEGYRPAAGVLLEHVRRTQADQDFLVFPIVLCWRHHLELRLKALLANLQELLGEPVELHVSVYNRKPRADLDNTTALLGQLDALDPTSEGFRYPVTAKGKPSLPDVARLHLRVLHESLEGVANLLSGANNLILVALDNKRDYQAAMQEKMGDADD